MERKPETASWVAWLLDGVTFVFDPILGILFFLQDAFLWTSLIDEETKPNRPLL